MNVFNYVKIVSFYSKSSVVRDRLIIYFSVTRKKKFESRVLESSIILLFSTIQFKYGLLLDCNQYETNYRINALMT